MALPGHLSEFHKRATKDLEPNESLRVADLLSRFQDSFSKGEWDLDLTHLAEHEIRTGDAAPIKQPSRRVPLAYADKERGYKRTQSQSGD